MSEWTDVTAGIAAAGTVFTAIAAAYAGAQVRQAKHQFASEQKRQLVLMQIEISRKWDDPNLVEARCLVQKHADAAALLAAMKQSKVDHSEFRLKAVREPNFFEDLALMQKRGAVTLDLIADMFRGIIIETWVRWEPTCREFQEKNPRVWTTFEGLYKVMKRWPTEYSPVLQKRPY